MVNGIRCGIACFSVTLGLTAFIGATKTSSFDAHFPGWEMARFVPDEGRLVLEHQGGMVVVCIGEAIPGLPGVQLRAKNSDAALVEIVVDVNRESSSDASPTKRWLLIRRSKAGDLEFVEIRREADAAQILQAVEASSTLTLAVPVAPEQGLVGGVSESESGGDDGATR